MSKIKLEPKKRKWLLQRTIKLLEKKQENSMHIIAKCEVLKEQLKLELRKY